MAYSIDEKKERQFRAAEAMYHKGYSVEEIARQTGMSMLEAYDVVQKIFHLLQRRNRREAL